MASFSKKPFSPFGIYSLADLQDASTVVIPQATPSVALSPSSDSENVVTPTSNNVVPLTIQGQSSQAKALLRGEDNLGSTLFSFDPVGGMLLTGTAAISGSASVAGVTYLYSDTHIAGNTTIGASGKTLVVSGNLGVGVSPLHVLHLLDTKVESTFGNQTGLSQANRGWTINKPDPTDAISQGVNWTVSGTLYWGIGQDYDTLGGGGNADFINCYDGTANGGLGADIMRFCPANTNPYGQTLCSLGINGTPRFGSNLLFLRPVAYGLGGLGMSLSGGVAVDAAYDQTTGVLQNRPLLGYRFGGSTQNIYTQRQITLVQVTDGSTSGNRNYVLLNGALSGTAAAPRFNSTNPSFGPTFGIEGTDFGLSLFTAPVGMNQSPVYGLVLDTSGSLSLPHNLLVSGNMTVPGTLLLGPTTANSLSVTGSTTLTGTVRANSTVTIAPVTGRCLTLNHANSVGATIFINAAGDGTLRTVISQAGIFQWGTDLAFNGSGDFWFQNLQTSNAVIYCDAHDRIILGSIATSGGAVLGVSGGKAAFYGATAVTKPTITGSRGSNAALASLLTALASQGLITDSTTT